MKKELMERDGISVSFNPCFSGGRLQRKQYGEAVEGEGFNPCFSGGRLQPIVVYNVYY